MADTSRPTVEALIRSLELLHSGSSATASLFIHDAQEVLGALLTERDGNVTIEREEAEARYWAGAGCEEDDRG